MSTAIQQEQKSDAELVTFDIERAMMEVSTDPWSQPIEALDPSYAHLYKSEAHLEFFKRLRAEDPVHYVADSPFGPYWSITRYDDIEEVDRTHKVFSSEPSINIANQAEDFQTPMFIAMDQPKHDVQRKAAERSVKPRRLGDLEAEIRAVAGEILDGLPIGEEFNWVDSVSRAITQQMLGILFDVPKEDRHLLTYWSDVVVTPAGLGGMSVQERREELLRCLGYFMQLWQQRANTPEPSLDFISMLAHDPNTKDLYKNPMEFLGNLMLLIVGGNDTTRNSISASVLALNTFPEEYEKLKADHSLLTNLVPETIRWQTPLAHMRRTALSDYELGGKTIKAGDKVVMWFISGNRDETKFEDPDRFSLDRDPKNPRHLSFGVGIHRCMGFRIGEMQLRMVWEEILKRFSHVEVTGEPERVASNFVRGYNTLPVTLQKL